MYPRLSVFVAKAYWYGRWQVLSSITTLAWKPSWQSLLANGTVNNPAHPPNNLTGIVYGACLTLLGTVPALIGYLCEGDYYYIKAGNDLLAMNKTTCT